MAGNTEVRVALLGFGLAGSVFHGPLIAATPGLRLATVVTSDPQRRARARRQHPAAAVHDRVEDFRALARDHELVVVATSNREHETLARAALEAGLAVVVEKPVAATSTGARALADLAQKQGQLLTVFHNRRFDAEMLTLQRLLTEGRLGEVVRMESRFERWRPEVTERWRESADPRDAGGVLFDLGSHLVDQAMHLFGRPARVYAEVSRRRPGGATDDDDFVALHHDGGIVSHLWVSLLAGQTGPRLRVRGLRGTFVVEALDAQEDALRAGADPASPGWGVVPRDRWGALYTGGAPVPVESEPGGWPRFYTELTAALRGEGPVPVAADDAVAVIEVLEAARESARTGAVVRVSYSSPTSRAGDAAGAPGRTSG